MYDLDLTLARSISKESRFGKAMLTRYADDFVFSTNKPGACREFYIELERILSKTRSPQLQINVEKTRFMSRNGGSTIVTGLRIKQGGEVGIHSNYRDHVRLLLKLYAKSELKKEDVSSLRGHIAFISHADPQLFTRLSFRYFDEIHRLQNEKDVSG
jgi:RNA-directed DNA polymerase